MRCSGSVVRATAARPIAVPGVAEINADASYGRPTGVTSAVPRVDWIIVTVSGPTVAVVAPVEA